MSPPSLAYSIADWLGAPGCGAIAGFEAAAAWRRGWTLRGYCRGLAPGAGEARGFETVRVPRIPLLGRTGWGKRWMWRFEAGWFDAAVAARLGPSDYFHGWAFQALESLRAARRLGAFASIERGSSHVLDEVEFHREERARLGLTGAAIVDHPEAIERCLAEYREADRIVVPSAYVRDSMLRRGIGRERLIELPLGVDLATYTPGAWPRPGAFTVAYVGRLAAIKGVRDLVEGFVRAALPDARLVLMGPSGPEAPALGPLDAPGIECLPAADAAGVAALCRRAHLVAVPSIDDGFARVVTEAMACATPVLVTPHVGAAEWVRDRVEGYRVPIRDPGAIAACLVEAAGDPARLAEMGRAAAARVAGMGWEWYADELLAQLEAARAGRARPVALPPGLAP